MEFKQGADYRYKGSSVLRAREMARAKSEIYSQNLKKNLKNLYPMNQYDFTKMSEQKKLMNDSEHQLAQQLQMFHDQQHSIALLEKTLEQERSLAQERQLKPNHSEKCLFDIQENRPGSNKKMNTINGPSSPKMEAINGGDAEIKEWEQKQTFNFTFYNSVDDKSAKQPNCIEKAFEQNNYNYLRQALQPKEHRLSFHTSRIGRQNSIQRTYQSARGEIMSRTGLGNEGVQGFQMRTENATFRSNPFQTQRTINKSRSQ